MGLSSPASSFQEFSALAFPNARNGMTLGVNGQGVYVMHQTSDAGHSWHVFKPMGLLQPASEVVLYLTFLNAHDGWTIIKDEQGALHLFQTNDSGHSWHELHTQIG